jgi:hypothetical protein
VVTETEQRFILRRVIGNSRASSDTRSVGSWWWAISGVPPVPSSEDDLDLWIVAGLGVCILLWTWFVDWRLRVKVTEQKVTVVNLFSRYELPWSTLNYVDLGTIGSHSGGGDPLSIAWNSARRQTRL